MNPIGTIVAIDDRLDKVDRLRQWLLEYTIDDSFVRDLQNRDPQELAATIVARIDATVRVNPELWLIDVVYRGAWWMALGETLLQIATERSLRSRVEEIHSQLNEEDNPLAASLAALLEAKGCPLAFFSRVSMDSALPQIAGDIPADEPEREREQKRIRNKLDLLLAPRFRLLLDKIRLTEDRHHECERAERTRLAQLNFLSTEDWEEFLKEVVGVRSYISVRSLFLAGCLCNPTSIAPSALTDLVNEWNSPSMKAIAVRWSDFAIAGHSHADRVVRAWLRMFDILCQKTTVPIGLSVLGHSVWLVCRDEFANLRDTIKEVTENPEGDDHDLSRNLVEFMSLASWAIKRGKLEQTSGDHVFRVAPREGHMLVGFHERDPSSTG